MNPVDQIKAILNGMSDDELKAIVVSFYDLHNAGYLPKDAPFKKFAEGVCNLTGIKFDLKLGESWLQDEVFKRYLKTNDDGQIAYIIKNTEIGGYLSPFFGFTKNLLEGTIYMNEKEAKEDVMRLKEENLSFKINNVISIVAVLIKEI